MIGIYKITSPSKKVYIGQSIDIENRFKGYRSSLHQSSGFLKKSFFKYGTDSHTFEVLEECDISELNIRERYYQDFFSVIGKNGLNSILTNPVLNIKYFKRKLNETNKMISHVKMMCEAYPIKSMPLIYCRCDKYKKESDFNRDKKNREHLAKLFIELKNKKDILEDELNYLQNLSEQNYLSFKINEFEQELKKLQTASIYLTL